ncbi:MAG: selenocysteine synthase [Planctomycetaceae bacterium]|nr:selenocysteine synthase [Planctomycetaceae bacterium]
MCQEVLDAFNAAAQDSVPIDHLQAAASRHIAKTTGAEAGLVTAGSAAALTLGAAAILAKFDLGRMEQLPQTRGFPNRFIVSRDHRNGYDHAVRAAGVEFIEVGLNEIVSNAGVRRTEAWELETVIDDSVAGVFYVLSNSSQPPLADVVECAHRHNLPVLVDAAGELPPRENLKKFVEQGADLVAFSGGKAIRGPQSTGILCGRKELISSATLQMLDMDEHFDLWEPPADWIDKSQLNGIPRHGIGRALKVSKEEIIALLTALDLFASGHFDDQVATMQQRLEQVVTGIRDLPVEATISESPDGQRFPLLAIKLTDACHIDATEACRQLRSGSPPVYPSHGRLHEGILMFNALSIKAEQIPALIDRLNGTLAT